MRRHMIEERPHWRATAETFGFRFADMYGAKYWDESAMFSFTLEEIEGSIEDPSRDLHQMCLELAGRAVGDARLLSRLGIPAAHHDYVSASWRNRAQEPSLYGRFDLAYDGTGPAKLLEYNADTPTGLYEAAVFQWLWLEDLLRSGALPPGTDQFNSIQEHLVERLCLMPQNAMLHIAGAVDNVEDGGTLSYLADCALQAGYRVKMLAMEDIGIDPVGRFTDLDDLVIERMFKLHPWEWMLAETFGQKLPHARCTFMEPPWKAMLSTKAILPLLWEMFPGHPNLLPAYFEDDPRAGELRDYARKPLFSREGENVTLVRRGRSETVPGHYGDGPFVVQAATHLFETRHGHAVIGSWMVGDEPCGMGIREDTSAITMNMSRFVPHIIAV
ncbi:hypothetical protein GCM10007301_39800 [Azorhizobium oxalatiphilum]|uniref:Glutathionylspermidine synthase pre-ATP-grasp-like domain-containing protein n=1 Tax=Azorhizobium oxalatiphilum TaxID=980631 RepID=A0A917C8L1_9HYPH|nr:glutathionylspermidine synthase family protein [Azorhizobium oxalatiphilum]GGF75874.1 hypothetical protein GCM10007301_39800 [Azorhizobium oxalatiphilum]